MAAHRRGKTCTLQGQVMQQLAFSSSVTQREKPRDHFMVQMQKPKPFQGSCSNNRPREVQAQLAQNPSSPIKKPLLHPTAYLMMLLSSPQTCPSQEIPENTQVTHLAVIGRNQKFKQIGEGKCFSRFLFLHPALDCESVPRASLRPLFTLHALQYFHARPRASTSTDRRGIPQSQSPSPTAGFELPMGIFHYTPAVSAG